MTTLGKIIIGVVLIGGVGLGGYMVTSFMKEDVSVMEREQKALSQEQKNESATSTGNTSSVASFGNETVTNKEMSFTNLLSKGGSYMCDITQTVSGVATKGKVYVSEGFIRGDFTTQTQGMSISSYMIMRDGYTYTWTNMAPTTGYKVKVPTGVQASSTTKTQGAYSWDTTLVGEYSCVPWAKDVSKFEVPSTVTFTTITP